MFILPERQLQGCNLTRYRTIGWQVAYGPLTAWCRSVWLALWCTRTRTRTSCKASTRDLKLLSALEVGQVHITTIKPTNEHGAIFGREEDIRRPVPLRRGQVHGCPPAAGDRRNVRHAMQLLYLHEEWLPASLSSSQRCHFPKWRGQARLIHFREQDAPAQILPDVWDSNHDRYFI